jgi:hypothetical protein
MELNTDSINKHQEHNDIKDYLIYIIDLLKTLSNIQFTNLGDICTGFKIQHKLINRYITLI